MRMDREEEFSNISCDVYKAEYTKDLAAEMNENAGQEVIAEPLTAVISQEYYVDSEKEQLICIVTDLTDLYTKNNLAIKLMSGNLTLEEAEEETDATPLTKETFKILSYDDHISIDLPDV